MSTREKVPWLASLAIVAMFCVATLPAWGLRKNVANQKVCAVMLTTAGAGHTTGTTTVYSSHNDGTTQTSLGTASHYGNGEWCFTIVQASDTNHDDLHLTWVNSGAVTAHQSYNPFGYDVTAAQVPANLTHVNGTANTTSTALVGVTVNSIANDVITANSIAASAIGASEIATDAIGADEVASGAMSAAGTEITGGAITTVTTTTTATNLTNNQAKYMHGAVWIGTDVNTNTTSYVDGIMTNPVSTIAAAKTIADNLKLKRFWLQSGTNITLGADYVGYVFDGRGYALNLASRDVSKSQIDRCENLTGSGATTPTGELVVFDSHIGSLTVGEADFTRSHLNGTITQSQASVPYLYHGCSGVGTAAKIVFNAASQTAVVAKWSGALTIAGMAATNTLWIDGNGDVTLDATNNSGATVYVSGNIRLTNTAGITNLIDSSRWDENQSVASVTGAVGSVTGNVGGSVASVTGAVGSVTGNVGGNVTGSVGSVTAAVTATDMSAVKAVTDKLDTTLVQDGAVYDFTAAALAAAPTGGSAPSAADVADAVWDEALAGHATGGSAGAALSAAGTAGDPWLTPLPGSYTSGTAGYILGNILADVRSGLSQDHGPGPWAK